MATGPAIPTTPPDVAALIAKARVPRDRAAKKVADVLRRVDAGEPPLNEIREIWAYGSFARGALEVGDVDLYGLIDDPRTIDRFRMDVYFDRKRPFANHNKALGCSGSSLVSFDAHPVFQEPREPASPARLAELKAAGTRVDAVLPVEKPVIEHVVTDQPLAGPFVLLWARGDRLEWALDRLAAINPDPKASRFDRTTTVPLMDDLTPKMGPEAAFRLAAQIRQGNLTCRALVLQPAVAPRLTRTRLERRYWSSQRKGPSAREAAAAAALALLDDEAVDLRAVRLVDGPITTRTVTSTVLIDFNPWFVYLASTGRYPDGYRVLQVWPTNPKGPWLALDVMTLDQSAARALDHELSDWRFTREERVARLLNYLPGSS
jgi:hypothetical protein